jgi:DUF1009 family protein
MAASGKQPVGLVAGWGDLPLVVAETLCHRGQRIVCVGVREHVAMDVFRFCAVGKVLGLGQLGKAVRFFRSHGVTEATMAGKIFKTRLLRRGLVLRERPDWLTIRTFARHFFFRRKDCRDDSLLTSVVEAFKRYGIRFRPATELVPELLAPAGVLTRAGPTRAEWADIRFGWKMAKGIGGLDIGQTVCVKNLTVLAVEAIEGTDECIRRAGTLCPAGNFTIVKVAKPQQDMRFDVPTIGPLTVQLMVESRARVLAVEAERTILLHPEESLRRANEHGLVVVALKDPLEG